MKFAYSEINHVFDTECNKVNSIIVENQSLFFRMLTDIQSQIDGNEGKTVVSKKDKILPLDKHLELLSQFVPFDINRKTLINKAIGMLEKKAVQGEQYDKTMKLLSDIERYMYELSFDLTGDINFSKISMDYILKAVGLEFCNDYDSLGEKIIDYMELVTEYDRSKLFVFVNLRSFMDDSETALFMETVLTHGYHIIMIESSERNLISQEKRYIIDKDLCEIE